jgi:hypothetical protein
MSSGKRRPEVQAGLPRNDLVSLFQRSGCDVAGVRKQCVVVTDERDEIADTVLECALPLSVMDTTASVPK